MFVPFTVAASDRVVLLGLALVVIGGTVIALAVVAIMLRAWYRDHPARLEDDDGGN